MPSRRPISPLSSTRPSADADRGPAKLSAGRDRSEKAQVLPSTRERILTAAERLFAEHGFSSVSMPRIAKASGITAGAIYKHFDSKSDLFFEVVRRAVQSAPAPVAAGGSESVAALLAGIVAMYTTHRLKLLRQLAVEIHYASVKHPRIRRLLRQSLDASIQQIRDGIVGAQQAGKLDPAVDPELLASSLMVFVMGLMHMETLLPKLVGDPKWHDFVQNRVLALIGLR